MNVALYSRVSSEDQKQAGTIETQNTCLETWCQQRGHNIVARYEDADVSGTVPLAERPAGGRLLSDSKTGQFEAVVFYRTDRLGRSQSAIWDALRDFDQAGVGVISTTESFDTVTPAGRAMLGMLATFAAFERDSLLQRSRDGMRRLAHAGTWLGGPPPYGYRVEGTDAQARIVVSEEPVPGHDHSEAEIVRLIFRLLVEERRGLGAICTHLNLRRVPTPYYSHLAERRRGMKKKPPKSFWVVGSLYQIATNPVYKGRHQWGRDSKRKEVIERDAPAIVGETTWEQAQRQLKSNLTKPGSNASRIYLLRSLIHCGACGCAFIGTNWKNGTKGRDGAFWYLCNGRHIPKRIWGPDALPCCSPYLPGTVEEDVWADIMSFLRNPGKALRLLREKMEKQQSDVAGLQQEASDLQRALSSKTEERQSLIGLFRQGIITQEDLSGQLDQVAREADAIKGRLHDLRQQIGAAAMAEASLEEADLFLQQMQVRLEEPFTEEQRRRLIELFVERITVDYIEGETRVAVDYKFHQPESAPGVERREQCASQKAGPLSSETPLRSCCLLKVTHILGRKAA